ncbi:hypothetical protein GCM10022295_93000 [Streptomyces osmaniensis]|uniref:Uncharacterized protein n=1 Tax=Streptomyces osmaniensis TaxID=593134 RepID=A0ABP6Z4K4_9ACTN
MMAPSRPPKQLATPRLTLLALRRHSHCAAITEREAVDEPIAESAAEAVSDEQLVAMLVDRPAVTGCSWPGSVVCCSS